MGMFDSVWATCPECKASVEFQSKAGDCALHDYSADDVPMEIAKDINGEVANCSSCNFPVRIALPESGRIGMKIS